MSVLLMALLGSAFANESNDSLNKKTFLLRRAIKNGDCNQADELVTKLLVENPSNAPLWKIRAETDACLKKGAEELYLSYEKYLEFGGEKSEVTESMSALESKLYSAEITIRASGNNALNWSKIEVTLPSDRFVKESEGVYRLKFTTPKEYELSVMSSDPLVESVNKSLEGKGLNVVDLALQTFAPATLTIPKYDDAISLQIFPANNSATGFSGTAGSHPIGAGPLKVKASYTTKSVEYNVDVSAGDSSLTLPWGYKIEKEGTVLYSEFFPPSKADVVYADQPVPSQVEGLDALHLSYEVTQESGVIQILSIPKETLESSPLFRQIAKQEELLQKQSKANKNGMLSMGGTGAVFLGSAGLQFLALQAATEGNGITDKALYSDYQQLSENANSMQRNSIIVAGVGGVLLGTTLYLQTIPKAKIKKELEESQNKLESLKTTPIELK